MATISQALAIAIQHHQAGRLQAAEQIYRQILAAAPNHAEAIHFLGLLAHQEGRHEIAAQYIGRAIALDGNVAAYHGNLGNALYALRRIPEAVACYRRAIELEPDSAQMYYSLGVMLKDQGKPDEAVACYRRALELKPDFAQPHNDLGIAFWDRGNLDQAVASYRRALELKPDYTEAHNNLGVAFRDQGNLDQAAACFRRALELKPDFAEAYVNLGNALGGKGQPDEAVACYRRALELKPDDADAHNNLGVALRDQGNLDQAVACFRRALALEPDFPEAHNNLGSALEEQGRLDEAVAAFRRALELRPDYAEAHGNLGNVFRDQRKRDAAVACFRRALELKPGYAEVHVNLGDVLEEIGDLRGAEDCFRAALRHNARFAPAHYNLAKLLGGNLPRQDLALQRRLLEEEALPDAQRSALHFALAYVLDAWGRYAEAAEHLQRANALQLSESRRRGREYDPKEHESLVTRTIGVCTPAFFQGVRGFGSESEIPVFVVGLPRSGTTLVEQILAGHSQVFGAGESTLVRDTLAALAEPGADALEGLGRLDRQTAGRLAARHLEELRAFSPAALRIVDKTPENYLHLGLLASLFPRAKLIHCRRDLRDAAVSCWMTHFQDFRWANDPSHIASRFQQYRRIMEHWRNVLPVPVLEVDYEETVADPESVARKLLANCGLAWEPACLEFYRAKRPVRTASSVQVRQPVYRTSVGRWQRYQHALAALFAKLDRVAGPLAP